MTIPLKVEEYFNLWAKDFDNLPRENSYHMQLIADEIRRMQYKGRLNILDLGTGNGRLILAIGIANHYYLGLDVSAEQLSRAEGECRKKGIIASFKKCDLENGIPLIDNSIDIIISNASFHHIANKQKLLCESYRVLNWGGKIILFDFYFGDPDTDYLSAVSLMSTENPNAAEQFKKSIKREHDLMPLHLEQTHPLEFHASPKQLLDLISRAGFSNCEIIPSYYIKYFGIRGEK